MRVGLSSIAYLPVVVRIIIFALFLLFCWTPFLLIIHIGVSKDANLASILAMSIVGIEFLILLKLWSYHVYQISSGFEYYGWEWTPTSCLKALQGLGLGLSFCLGLFFLESILGWLHISPPSFDTYLIAFQGLMSALAVAFFEELFFRGFILCELERNLNKSVALISTSLLFATLHFIKPLSEIIKTLPQFPALILLGMILVWAKRLNCGRLGLSIGIHAGLIWGYYILNVGSLLIYTSNVPQWLTGINHNPLSGLMGLLFLSLLAQQMKSRSSNHR
jgi:hypothetical protein